MSIRRDDATRWTMVFSGTYGVDEFMEIEAKAEGLEIEIDVIPWREIDQARASLVGTGKSHEQQARDILARMGVEEAMSAGDVVELANLLALLAECADHLAGALGAADRPDSDSGELYARIQSVLGGSK